jgi:uncharacterized membrane protein
MYNKLRRHYAGLSNTDRLLLLSSLFSLLLLAIRIIATGRLLFLFLPWNLFLAFVPYFIVNKLLQQPGWIEDRRKFIPVFLCWLLFIPNSFYILTDLYHLDLSRSAPRWFDLTLIFSFAWNGLLLGVLSVRRMEWVMQIFLQRKTALFFLYPVMWLIAWGIYIGRYLRFNSWDIITNPLSLLAETGQMFTDPLRYSYAWAMIFCFSVFMTLLYLGIKNISFSFHDKNNGL